MTIQVALRMGKIPLSQSFEYICFFAPTYQGGGKRIACGSVHELEKIWRCP
jgi:hypothetical protein